MKETPPYHLVIDLEATCDDQGRMPQRQMEIIEIGAVLVRTSTLETVAELQTFVKPVRHPTLTDFCRKLTTITQADVDAAPRFPEALERLRQLIDGRDALFCSWGDYDRNQFNLDARRHNAALPFGGRHLNIKKLFSKQLEETELYGMGSALKRVGLRLQGTHHRGIDDARNIARLLPYALGRVEVGRGQLA